MALKFPSFAHPSGPPVRVLCCASGREYLSQTREEFHSLPLALTSYSLTSLDELTTATAAANTSPGHNKLSLSRGGSKKGASPAARRASPAIALRGGHGSPSASSISNEPSQSEDAVEEDPLSPSMGLLHTHVPPHLQDMEERDDTTFRDIAF